MVYLPLRQPVDRSVSCGPIQYKHGQVHCWSPAAARAYNDAQVQLANEIYRIQEPVLGISLGMTFDYY